jgi:hypothetical protein
MTPVGIAGNAPRFCCHGARSRRCSLRSGVLSCTSEFHSQRGPVAGPPSSGQDYSRHCQCTCPYPEARVEHQEAVHLCSTQKRVDGLCVPCHSERCAQNLFDLWSRYISSILVRAQTLPSIAGTLSISLLTAAQRFYQAPTPSSSTDDPGYNRRVRCTVVAQMRGVLEFRAREPHLQPGRKCGVPASICRQPGPDHIRHYPYYL